MLKKIRPQSLIPNKRGRFLPSLLALTLYVFSFSSVSIADEQVSATVPSQPVSSNAELATSVQDAEADASTKPSSIPEISVLKGSAAMPAKQKLSISETSNWLMVVLTLLGIIGSILLVAWIAKRFTGMSATNGKDMRVVGAIALGARERVAVIDIKGEQFLLGVTPQNISFLHRFDEAPISTTRSNSGEFAQKLQAILSSSMKGESLEASMHGPSSKTSEDGRKTVKGEGDD
jgi:flagellar biosynthetic protein FliO